MTIKNIKQIEKVIDACIQAHDEALRTKDKKMQLNAVEVMQYELKKLDENIIKIKTKDYIN